MRELLTKGNRSPVIKKAAAIILSITLTVIGSVSTANAAEMIATKPAAIMTLTTFQENNAIDIFGLPKRETLHVPLQIEMPKLESTLANIIRNPEEVLGEFDSHADSRIPSIDGLVTSTFRIQKASSKR